MSMCKISEYIKMIPLNKSDALPLEVTNQRNSHKKSQLKFGQRVISKNKFY